MVKSFTVESEVKGGKWIEILVVEIWHHNHGTGLYVGRDRDRMKNALTSRGCGIRAAVTYQVQSLAMLQQLIWLGWCCHPVHEKLKVLLGKGAILHEHVPECRINVKLGSINTIPDSQLTSWKEIIEDLREMAQDVHGTFWIYGVSKGQFQFQEVLDFIYFRADGLQLLAFALCHVYTRSTHSISILAPVYYPDIICSQAKNHDDPQAGINLSDMATHTDTMTYQGSLEAQI
ncbi:hypothetical protein EDC04DRAFT_2614919 [Pisolithus marmoratus]|nr:hypothetical protein EDC04DRAFT_2614919 [Pisolithus marmoratus]